MDTENNKNEKLSPPIYVKYTRDGLSILRDGKIIGAGINEAEACNIGSAMNFMENYIQGHYVFDSRTGELADDWEKRMYNTDLVNEIDEIN